MFPFREPRKNVWLITWEFARKDRFRDLGRRKIAAVLDSRVSDGFVARYLPLLYSTERDLLVFEKYREMYLQSCRRKAKIVRADKNESLRGQGIERSEVRSEDGWMVYGGHPWLSARRVMGFFVDVFDCDTENVYWTESARLRRLFDDSFEEITPQRNAMLKASRSSMGWDEVMVYGSEASPPKRPKRKTYE